MKQISKKKTIKYKDNANIPPIKFRYVCIWCDDQIAEGQEEWREFGHAPDNYISTLCKICAKEADTP